MLEIYEIFQIVTQKYSDVRNISNNHFLSKTANMSCFFCRKEFAYSALNTTVTELDGNNLSAES